MGAICPIGQPQVDKFGPDDAGKRVLFGAPFQPANPHFKPNGNERQPQPAIPKRVGNQANPTPSQGQGRTLEFTNIDELRKMRQSGQMNMAPGNRNATNNQSPSNQMQLNKKDNNNATTKTPGVSIEFNSIDELRNSLKRASAHKEISDQPLNIGANQMAVKNDHINATPGISEDVENTEDNPDETDYNPDETANNLVELDEVAESQILGELEVEDDQENSLEGATDGIEYQNDCKI